MLFYRNFQNGGANLLNCIEDHIETNANCTLPWRTENNDADKTCEDKDSLDVYKKVQSDYRDSGEQEVYDWTGCYYNCSHYVSLLYVCCASIARKALIFL